ncbi:hypothetical protein ACO0K9_26895 [Undibacterium sp. Ji50W]|uniref:hypothetical protein n=1 Tax=Undibacterium sp. Ji50W TaxID=3413041 RepID=UPI003BF3BE51
MTASHFYLLKPGWQKPVYLTGIMLLHVLLLLLVRQALQRNAGQQEIYKYLDVSFVAAIPRAQVGAPQAPTSAALPKPIVQLPHQLRDNRTRASAVAPAMSNQVSEHEASSATTSSLHDGIALDLNGLRKAALAEDKKYRRTEVNRVPIPATAELKFEEKFGRDVQDARRKDCLNAYSNGARVGNVALAGLLVAGVIVADTVTGKGCKW